MIETIHYPAELPISGQRELIVETIRAHQVVVVAGDTGSGKSTQLPKMCLEAGRGAQKMIGCTQPRRIAATALAARVAEELGPAGREMVGYKIRFRDKTGPQTRIKFMTDGILLAETRSGKRLAAYDTLIIDEAHERSLNIDFLLGYLKNLISVRQDLKILITSATIDTEKFSAHFNSAPVIEVTGRTFPVEVRYQPPAAAESEEAGSEDSYVDRAVRAVLDLLERERPGDILVFMPTERDILETTESLTQAVSGAGSRGTVLDKWTDPLVLPLFGRLQAKDQNRIFRTYRGQKIVVATNVAETSLTVPGIRYVVDTGLARISTYNVRARSTSLPVTRISRASCEQRKGRCGRVTAGICIRLYSEDDFLQRPEFTLPEIKRSNLAEVVLRMLSLRLGEPAVFPFIDPPHPRAVKDGYALLAELGAIRFEQHQWRLTARGRLMAEMPLDPCIARMIIEARERNALREITVIAAALSIPDPRIRPAAKEEQADAAHAAFALPSSDFLSYLAIWDTFLKVSAKASSRSVVRKFCQIHFLSFQRMREWRDIHDQITDLLAETDGFLMNARPASYDAIHQSIVSGFLRNIAAKKTGNIYQGTHDKEITIFPGSYQFNKGGQWIVAAEFIETSKLFARTVAFIKVEWLERIGGTLCRSTYSEPHWEKRRGQVTAHEKVMLFGLILVAGRKVNYGKLGARAREEARRIFIHSALLAGELQGSYPFLDHNLGLIADIEQLEDRFRQRGVLADDQVLYAFYDRRLPAAVFDQAGLNRLLKQKKSDEFLQMQEQDVLIRPPDLRLESDFPETIDHGRLTFRLSYRFQPGAVDDGVTVNLPGDLPPELSSEVFEWLVPGLLLEKITCLLKGLPKNIRRQLIPIPQNARELAEELAPYEGSLYQALEQAVYRRFKVRIARSQWPLSSLPPHLRMRYRLIDTQGRELDSGRNFPTPHDAGAAEKAVPDLAALKAEWEREHITGWDFAELPETIPLQTDAGWHGFVYLGLAANSQEGQQPVLAIRLFADRDECREATRVGLLGLYQLQVPRQIKQLKAECAAAAAALTSEWRLLEGLSGRQNLKHQLSVFVLEELFDTRSGTIPDRQAFEKTVEEAKQEGFYRRGRNIVDRVIGAIRERRATLDHIAKFKRLTGAANIKGHERFGEYRSQVARYLPPDFLASHDLQRITTAERYLKALRIRVERAYAAPDKDAAKEAVLRPLEQRLKTWQEPDIPAPECCRLLAEYEQMLEEFKISLFAQEMKTLFPVSAKKIEEKWRELLRSC